MAIQNATTAPASTFQKFEGHLLRMKALCEHLSAQDHLADVPPLDESDRAMYRMIWEDAKKISDYGSDEVPHLQLSESDCGTLSSASQLAAITSVLSDAPAKVYDRCSLNTLIEALLHDLESNITLEDVENSPEQLSTTERAMGPSPSET